MNPEIPSSLIVSVSGIRGIVGKSLLPATATTFAAALGTYLGGGRVVVSRDSRPSGRMLNKAVIAGLTAVGCSVYDIGVAATPTCGIAVRQLSAAGAIQITASHNPAPWNGLKMFGNDGAVLSAERGKQVQRLFERGPLKWADWSKQGEVHIPPDLLEDHARMGCDIVSVADLQSRHFRVLLDANGGAGGPLGLNLLHHLGCEVVAQGCNADGVFMHEAEPIPAHLTDVAPRVKEAECAVGFVLDPDADRLALIDENGKCISEELTLALAVQFRLAESPGPVVINMSSSRVVEDLAMAAGVLFHRTAVGEANVVAGMKAMGAVIGGEGNGGVIDPRLGWVRDPFAAMPMILQHMQRTKKPLSQLVAELPKYEMLKQKYDIDRAILPTALEAIQDQWSDAQIDTTDGLRLDWKDSWVHIRPSNTEPVVRVIAEAPTRDQAEKLCTEAAKHFNS
ncbi:MAG: phosphoglucosamine mutase [Zavarzinella sp.]